MVSLGRHFISADVEIKLTAGLDGGGVRGLSSLLILQLLLVLVTEELINAGIISKEHATIEPQDVFDVATGTSTGG
jgi:patatin-like phospholipase/acyl hydrolase